MDSPKKQRTKKVAVYAVGISDPIHFRVPVKKMDRKLVAAGQPYEVAYFTRKHGITAAQARAIIKANGPSRRKCDAAAKGLG